MEIKNGIIIDEVLHESSEVNRNEEKETIYQPAN